VTRRRAQPASSHVSTAVLLGSFAFNKPDRLHDLIRTARAGSPKAIAKVLDGVQRTILDVWPGITEATIVPVPPHVPGHAHPLLLAICEEIATARGWRVATEALRRIGPAPEGKAGGARNPESEATTLIWDGSSPSSAIVLVDDVVRSGATLQACAGAVRAGGDDRTLLAIALARVENPGQGTKVALPIRP